MDRLMEASDNAGPLAEDHKFLASDHNTGGPKGFLQRRAEQQFAENSFSWAKIVSFASAR